MARFHRDEQRTYPIWWLIAGGLFIFSTAWACYAEFVTRVPWQKEQDDFYQMEYELAKQNKKRADLGQIRFGQIEARSTLARLRRRRAGQDVRQKRSRRSLLLPAARRIRSRRRRRE